MASPPAAAPPSSISGSSVNKEAGKSLSGFLARVMDQLSITSWLPGLFLVGNAALLFALSEQTTLSLPSAISDLSAMKWGALVVLLFAVVSAAVSIQAFEFEILRFFEGYHRSERLQGWADSRIEKQRARRATLEEEAKRLEKAAFISARASAVERGSMSESDEAAWSALEKLMLVQGWKPTPRICLRWRAHRH